jgi:hypothetical protein
VKSFIIGLFGVALMAAAPAPETFTGVIADDACVNGDHSRMRMGANDAECTKACAALHGAAYVLVDGKTTYALSDQQKPEAFAGRKVTVVGTLDPKTSRIAVDSIEAAR